MAAASLRIDQHVDIRVEHGRVIIERVAAREDELSALLARMTPDTFPEESDFKPALGREIW